MQRTDVLSREQIRAYAAGALPHATPAQLDIAVAIALAESGGRVGAVSTTNDHGIWQINARWHPTYNVSRLQTDPGYNAQAMASISSNGNNWNPWTTYKTGAYKRHLGTPTTSPGGVQGIAGQGAPGEPTQAQIEAAAEIVAGTADGAQGLVGGWVDEFISKFSKELLGLVFTVTGLALVLLGLSRVTKQSPTLQSASSALGTVGTLAALA